MTFDQHKDLAYATVVTPPSPASSGLFLDVPAGTAAIFPTPPYNATVWPAHDIATFQNAEIIRVTAHSPGGGVGGSDRFTITRAQGTSQARAIVATDQIAATITTKLLSDLEAIATQGVSVAAANRTYAQLSGASTNWSTPDSAVLALPSVVDVRMKMLLPTYNPGALSTLAAQFNTTGNQRGWQWMLKTDGTLQFQYSLDGSTTTTISSLVKITDPVANGGIATQFLNDKIWLRGVAKSNDPALPSHMTWQCYYSIDDGATWITLGGLASNTTFGTFFNSTASLFVGQTSNAANLLTGRVYRFQVYDGSPTLVADFLPSTLANPPVAISNGVTGETWTPQASAARGLDEVSNDDLRDWSLTPKKIQPSVTPDSYFVTDTSGNTGWRKSISKSVLNYGVIGDGIADDGPAFQALYDAASVDTGRVMDVPAGFYRIATPVRSVRPNLTLRCDPGSPTWYGVGFPGGARQQQSLGGAVFLIDTPNSFGFTFGDGTSQPINLAGPIFDGASFMPFGVHANVVPTGLPGGTFVMKLSDAGRLATWAAAHPTGSLWTQGTAGQIGKFTYTGVDVPNHQFTGVSLDHELIPSGAYGASCIVIVDRIKGAIRLSGVSNYRLKGCQFAGFLDQDVAAWPVYIDGYGVIPTTVSGTQTSPGSGSYSLQVASTAQYTASGQISVDGQTITYTSIDATHFLGCTGGYSHTYPNNGLVALATVAEPQYGEIEDCFLWSNYRGIVNYGGQMRLDGCTIDAGVNNTSSVPNTLCLEIIDPGYSIALTNVTLQGADTLVRATYGPLNKRNGIQASPNSRYEAWAAAGFAFDIGVNDCQIYGRIGTSHTGGKMFNVQSGALRNFFCVAGATTAGEGLWTDAGTGTRFVNPITGEQYGLGPIKYTSGTRPSASAMGQGVVIYDTTLSVPLWSDGSNWRDGAGTIR